MGYRLLSMVLWLFALAGCAPALRPDPTAAAESPSPAATPTAESDGLRIRKYPGNYAAFKLTMPSGVTIITDPYGMDETIEADIVTVSHPHEDHADLSRILPGFELIDAPGTYTVRGITITGVAGRHNKGDPTTTNTIFVFDTGGLRLAHFASQGELPTEEMFAALGRADILILQIYGAEAGKLSVEEAGTIARRLQSKIVIPAHSNPDLSAALAAELNASFERVAGGALVVRKDDLGFQTTPKVAVMDVP